ncbi:MAG: hypothetical protein ACTMIR_05810 [Cellulomonadaceae bacterium]
MRRGTVGALAAASVLLLGGCGPGGPFGEVACPAIGYLDLSPIELRLDGLPADAAVAACFGADCTPADVVFEGGWFVPQESPYLPGPDEPIDTVGVVRVLVTDAAGQVLHNAVHEIPVVSESSGPCPGPFHYDPVDVP